MRLPIHHRPPDREPPVHRCAHLEALAEAAVGLPLGPAAEFLGAPTSRGRHGNALQWHFGLEPHDGVPRLDWEDRIELKLVSVWLRPTSAASTLVSDKIKVCDLSIDPWHKLSNVLWVFADRLTRVVVGYRFTHLAGPRLQRLSRAWQVDPHFDRPDLFVEAREQASRTAPAYYLSAAWLREEGILPARAPGVFPFDSVWWKEVRARDPLHRAPRLAVVESNGTPTSPCPQCGGTLSFDPARVQTAGWAPANHAPTALQTCNGRGHAVIDGVRIAPPGGAGRGRDLRAALEGRVPEQQLWRLADEVPEPEDHLH